MTKAEALREENALCDFEENHSFSLGRKVTNAARVAALSENVKVKKTSSPKKSGPDVGMASDTLVIGAGAMASGGIIGLGAYPASGVMVIGGNLGLYSTLPAAIKAGKTEERGLAS